MRVHGCVCICLNKDIRMKMNIFKCVLLLAAKQHQALAASRLLSGPHKCNINDNTTVIQALLLALQLYRTCADRFRVYVLQTARSMRCTVHNNTEVRVNQCKNSCSQLSSFGFDHAYSMISSCVAWQLKQTTLHSLTLIINSVAATQNYASGLLITVKLGTH